MHRDLQTGDYVEPNRLKTGEFSEKWLEDMRSRVSPKTWERYGLAVRRHINPYLGQRFLKKLEPLDLTALYTQLLEGGRYKGGPLSLIHI